MSHPRTHARSGDPAASIRDHFAGEIKRPLLIVGNGPSAAVPQHDLLPDDPVVFRMNWFFLEDRYHFGRKVDGYFYTIPNAELERQLTQVVRERWYDVGGVFSPMRVPAGRDGETHQSDLYTLGLPEFDHWNAIAQNPTLARFMMSRPLPTQGVQVVAMALMIGFRDIALCGIDMYESASARYGFAIPDSVRSALQPKDLSPGYEDLHSLDRDLDFLDSCIVQFPHARITHVGPSRHLSARFPTPERRPRRCTFDGIDAAVVQAAAKPTMSSTDAGLVTEPGDDLPFAERNGRRCGFVTLVSGPFHHGARALARSLREVSDVPLLVMCTPSADRAALRASGIACVDVPEIRNPNVLNKTSRRFATTYSKLNAFRMTHLDRAVYVDSDMIVLRSIDDLFDLDGFAAVPDHGLDHEYDRFNSGLFAFEPDVATFEHLVESIPRVKSYDHGDQGFLNEMFPDWIRLPHEYNVNKRWSKHHPNLFHPESTRVIHYVGTKPWQPEAPSSYDELHRLWLGFLDHDELIEVASELRAAAAASNLAQGRPSSFRGGIATLVGRLRGRRDRSARRWNEGTLLRRAQARNADGAHQEALELFDAEWPGDAIASAGLHRERAKTRVLCGDFAGGLADMKAAAQRFPTSATIRSNLARLEQIDHVRRLSRGLLSDSRIATTARQLARRS